MASGLVHLVRNLLFRGHLLIPCAKHAWPWSDGIALYLLTLKKKKTLPIYENLLVLEVSDNLICSLLIR